MIMHRVTPESGWRIYGLAVLTGLMLSFGLAPAALADDAKPMGTVIITLSAPLLNGAPTDQYIRYNIRARCPNHDCGGAADFRYSVTDWMLGPSPNDLAAAGGTGAVIVQQLPPGNWELFTFQANIHGGRWRPDNYFSIPFTIKPGRGTYLGDYQPMGHTDAGLLTDYPSGVRFVVTDHSARDIPIATAKNPGLGPVDIQVFNVDSMNNPLFGSADAPGPPAGESR